MSSVPTIKFNDGKSIPQLGFGVWKASNEQAEEAVGEAIKIGYRSIDTAKIYENEEGTGKAVVNSGIPREDLFVTTKLWNKDQGYDSTLKAFDGSLKRLGLDYVNLYLIHWPVASEGKYVDTFKAFQKLKSDGLVRSIGVSNFTIDNLHKLIDQTGETPVINQIELHPNLLQKELRAEHKKLGIVTEAWSPLGQGGDLLKDSTISGIAKELNKSPAQIILRWHIQQGNVVIPKSVTPARIKENFDIFDFELSDDQVQKIDSLDSGTRLGPNPETFTGLD